MPNGHIHDDRGEFAAQTVASPQPTSRSDSATADTMTAVRLGLDSAERVEISTDAPFDDLARLVGDPIAESLHVVPDVLIWVGDNSQFSAEFNVHASFVLAGLLVSVQTGDYPADARARAHAQKLLTNTELLPVIHGQAVITGIDPSSRERNPSPLSGPCMDLLRVYVHAAGLQL